MYRNYGDVNFLENGTLIQPYSESGFDILACRPYSDTEGKYVFAKMDVDITASWIDKDAVMSYIGMTESDFDPAAFAVGCIDYYSWDNFGADDYWCLYNWRDCNEETIRKELKDYDIDPDVYLEAA